MKIFSDFKFKNTEYLDKLAEPGDVVVRGCIKYIRTSRGYVSEQGYELSKLFWWHEHTVLIKKDVYFSENLEDLLAEGEKRCRY